MRRGAGDSRRGGEADGQPPRRFAPPLLKKGGETETRCPSVTVAAGLAVFSPPRMRRGAGDSRRGGEADGRPPRRFAPPLLKKGGETETRCQSVTVAAGLAVFSPPRMRRGAGDSRRGGEAGQPPRRFAPPLLKKGGETETRCPSVTVAAGLAVFSPPRMRRGAGDSRRGGEADGRPPRRFAPPLLKKGGETETRCQSVTVAAGLAVFSPPRMRRGAGDSRPGGEAGQPPRRFAPPLLKKGGESERKFQSVTVRVHTVTVRVHPVWTRFRYSTPTLPAAISRNAMTVGLSRVVSMCGVPPWASWRARYVAASVNWKRLGILFKQSSTVIRAMGPLPSLAK